MSEIDFSGLAHSLLFKVRELCAEWLPGGKVVGNEYTCANINGGEGSSFKVNLNTGKWADFAAGLKGGDLISLYAAIKNTSQIEAAKSLQGFAQNKNTQSRKPKVEPNTELLSVPPVGADKPSFDHFKHGKATAVWTYKDQEGSTLFYVSRHAAADGNKEFTPHSWSKTSKRWVRKMWPRPRPLYGLEYLKAKPTFNVMLVEGEKAADAARALCGDNYVVLSWPAGSNAVGLVDLTPIYGRKVLLWPDDDKKVYALDKNIGRENIGQPKPEYEQPGYMAMAYIADKLVDHCPEVKIIRVYDFDKPDGWDAADAVAEGWTYQKWKAWAKDRVKLWPKKTKAVKAEVMPEPPPHTDADFRAEIEVMVTEPSPEVSVDIQQMWTELGLSVTKGKGGKMEPLSNYDNVVRVLEHAPEFKGHIWYDEFYMSIMTDWRGETRVWRERDRLLLYLAIQREYGLSKISETQVATAIQAYAFLDLRNEPKDWMQSLTWDGIKRVDDFLMTHMGCTQEPESYLKAISSNFWVAMAARTYEPGCKFDNMVILEGNQGKGKSTALNIIGDKWFTETNEDPRNKDFYLVLRGALLVEIAELDSFSKAELNTVKKVMSCREDRYRAPYGHYVESHPRRCVFMGTTNQDDYLRDSSGARRFWPATTGEINLEKIKADREQLFAEAVWKYKNGFPYWEVPDAEAKGVQDERYNDDPWTEIVQTFLSGIRTIKLDSILTDCLEIDKAHIDHRASLRCRNILKRSGYKSRIVRVDKLVYRAWENISVDGDDYELRKIKSSMGHQSLLAEQNGRFNSYNGYKSNRIDE